ncbi:MAG: hypothetical protein ACP5HG_16555 [Anaerolineae bacterium]
MLTPSALEERVRQALAEGITGDSRGFVLIPSACPNGREIPPRVLTNCETVVRLAKMLANNHRSDSV